MLLTYCPWNPITIDYPLIIALLHRWFTAEWITIWTSWGASLFSSPRVLYNRRSIWLTSRFYWRGNWIDSGDHLAHRQYPLTIVYVTYTDWWTLLSLLPIRAIERTESFGLSTGSIQLKAIIRIGILSNLFKLSLNIYSRRKKKKIWSSSLSIDPIIKMCNYLSLKSPTTILILFILLLVMIDNVQLCPSKCKCQKKVVNCRGGGLTFIPRSIPEDIERL